MGGEKPDADDTVPASHAVAFAPELQVGATIGRYRLVSRLGAGAMGVVWRALDPKLDRPVAIKVVHDRFARSAEASNRLLREARAMAKLSHRAVVTVHDAGETEGRLFLAMELVEGRSLGQLLRARTDGERRAWRPWLEMMLTAGRGLEAAHGAGILHRDFKPENVLVDANGRVCVADFGLATLGDDRPQALSERISKSRILDLTTTGALLGTPAYMSPQQLRGEPIDARADQFNFCVATYEALFGVRPFYAGSAELEISEMLAVLERSIAQGDFLPPPDDSEVPEPVLAVLRRGMAPDPDARWPDMTTLLAALERAARPGRRATRSPTSQPPPRRRVIWLAAAGAAAVVGLLLLWLRADRSVAPVAKKLFDVPLKTRLAVTADGRRLALGSDRLEVRELGGTRMWTISAPSTGDFSALAVTNDEVVFGPRRGASMSRWRYASDNAIVPVLAGPGGSWFGETTRGHLFYHAQPHAPVSIKVGDRTVREWPTRDVVELFAVSPGRTRVAMLEATRCSGEIVVRDVERDTVVRSPRLASPTAMTWQDDDTLIYATGTTEKPTVFRTRVDASGFGAPEVLYTRDTGWIGEVATGGGQLFFIEMGPKSRARTIDRGTQLTRDLDAANIGAALAWIGDDEFLAWNRNSKRVERRSLAGNLALTPVTLADEPANATIAGDILITAIRTQTGREVTAHRLGTGALLWSLPAPSTHAVRCANDRQPPCYALRSTNSEEQLVAIDPETGALGPPLYTGMIEDVAIDAAGERIIVARRGGVLRELARDGTEVAMLDAGLSSARSIAFDPQGRGFLVAGTLVRNTFQVAHFDGKTLTPIAQAENDLLSLVRPSSDGKRILVHARVYAPVLWQMGLPR